MTAGASMEFRADLWRGARLLDALTGVALAPARYRAWPRTDAPPHGFADVMSAATWPTDAQAGLPLFLRCVGAAAAAGHWRRWTDGRRLRALAAALSLSLVDTALGLDPPPDPWDATDDEVCDEAAIAALGRRVLLASLPGRSAVLGPAASALARQTVGAAGLILERAGTAHA